MHADRVLLVIPLGGASATEQDLIQEVARSFEIEPSYTDTSDPNDPRLMVTVASEDERKISATLSALYRSF